MELGDAGTKLIQSFEGCSLTGYLDQRGIPTAGWGHVGPDVVVNKTYTPDEVADWFTQDTQTAVDAVNRLVTAPLNQNQFDALCSFTYNIGQGAFANSTLRKMLNAGTPGAEDQFLLWDHVNGVRSDGLHRRRVAERSLFLAA